MILSITVIKMSEKEKTTTNAIDQFLNAIKQAKDHPSAVDIIMQAVDSSSLYSFSEFLDVPLVASVSITYLA
jgi:hypothetical protein